jgi:hypothetical protein
MNEASLDILWILMFLKIFLAVIDRNYAQHHANKNCEQETGNVRIERSERSKMETGEGVCTMRDGRVLCESERRKSVNG